MPEQKKQLENQAYPMPLNEEERLCALAEYNLLDSPPTEGFDRLTRLAARIFDVPIVLISLVSRERQFFKSRVGVEVCETSREVSFCAHAITQDEILVVPDALEDPRFATNALVLGAPFIRFYAGKTLVAPGGEKLGTICLIDTKPRHNFSSADGAHLSDLAGLVMDQMENRRLEHGKEISQARFENIAATSPDAIICTDYNERITFWNSAVEKMFGYSASELAIIPSELLFPEHWHECITQEIERIKAGAESSFEGRTITLNGKHKNGASFPVEISLSSWKDAAGTCVGAIIRDVSERQMNEQRLIELATQDALTGLPNREACRLSLTDNLAAGCAITVLLVDLDNFKEVNDSLGHMAGDAVLKQTSRRLLEVCSNAIVSARLGGDEFVTLLPGSDIREAKHYAKRLLDAFSVPFEYNDKAIEVGLSIGISMAPEHGYTVEDVLGAADLALYKSKSKGKSSFHIFTHELREVAVARRAFEKELRFAFEQNQFELYYQPQIDIATHKLVGAEALIRWNHPERGVLTPASFIEVLSKKASVTSVGEWILRTSCEFAAKCIAFAPDFRVGVNLFEAQIHSGMLYNQVEKILNDTKVPAHCLELELVENILLRSDENTVKLLHRLRTLGVGLAFDDYGTGYASLSLLKRFPVTRLKIDRSFIRDVETDKEDVAVVKAIIYLGESFGLEVIAEGVENQAQLDFLKLHNCTEVQGYLIGRPVCEKDFFRQFIQSGDYR